MTSDRSKVIKAIPVKQWLQNWDTFQYNPSVFRRKPKAHFYLFTMNARDLKALSGIQRRQVTVGEERSHEIGIQRRHEGQRSEEIGRFVLNGYPWSGFAKSARESGQFDDLRKPGWLPTAVVVNILEPKNKRKGQKIFAEDCIAVRDAAHGLAEIVLPDSFSSKNYKPRELYPIEVIDGQHRLWAFEENSNEGVENENFELPVVAFHGLDISWQAYLFYTINIKPKKINASLAYDLYPLLRTEDWLDKFEGKIYRETRAQELTELMWLHPKSSWHNRINMLGDPSDKSNVSQAAWIRALMATYVKASEGRKIVTGGLFGAPVGQDKTTLPWSRTQQAAFLIYLWQQIQSAVERCDYDWAESLRKQAVDKKRDAAFFGTFSLLNQDQGVRGVLFATNDLCFAASDSLSLETWFMEESEALPDTQKISDALRILEDHKISAFLKTVASALAKYDWRSASFPELSDEERIAKMVFRGSGGYTELKKQLVKLLLAQPGIVGRTAARLTVGRADG
jgi:DGQHR domain-containing protein